MLFQDAPPNTSAYMIAGYVVFAVIIAIYLFSLVIRKRNLDQDLSTLEGMRQERAAAESKPVPVKRKPARTRASRSKPVGRKAVKRK